MKASAIKRAWQAVRKGSHGTWRAGNNPGFRSLRERMSRNAWLVLVVAITFAALAATWVFEKRPPVARAVLGPTPTAIGWAGRIDLVAGDGVPGMHDGIATQARFADPYGVAVAKDGAVFVSDAGENNRIRRIDMSTNIIDCIAGKLEAGYSGDGGAAIDAQLNYPSDIELGPDGRLYIADRFNHVIRAMDLVTGTIETVAGTGQMCDVEDAGGCPDELPARQVGLKEPYGIAFDAAGNLYIADTHNSRILRVAR
jgi:hypothetical protein